jgi:hypothetical protein
MSDYFVNKNTLDEGLVSNVTEKRQKSPVFYKKTGLLIPTKLIQISLFD